MKKNNQLSINFHLLEACNMRCGFCFAKYSGAKRMINPESALDIICQVADAGFGKISFAGGEPLLYAHLPQLIAYAKSHGLTTMLITNGYRLTENFLNVVHRNLDWIGLSIDSISKRTNLETGRADAGFNPLGLYEYSQIIKLIKQKGIALKINTVVHELNYKERLSDFILDVEPERWKIMQVMFNEGSNTHSRSLFEISEDQFSEYVIENRIAHPSIEVVAEPESLIRGSYLMIDPNGRLYDSNSGKHQYSEPILEVGLTNALRSIDFDSEKFEQRKGNYNWNNL